MSVTPCPSCLLYVAVHTPAHSSVGGPLSYTHATALPAGTLVRVPLGRREVLGVVWEQPPGDAPAPAAAQLRPIASVLDGLALSRDYQIEYPSERLTLSQGDAVEIAGQSYRVREVRQIRDGSESVATLSRL